ncbi:helix-turn-helix domain-containing protein [Pseudarthrobacter sulfonivorans]|uniref:helix-turn-helix domain-containing protein n=1 Tax=Pseudarthrobacter sulfonivorans TaxID=121292 RepID=UPI000AC6A69E|nr:helix-turn-helix domain-containing protein [Pseudarthrobacter sulfonivorans]
MPRFLTLADVAEQLQINSPAAYALVRSGELKAIQVGGRRYLGHFCSPERSFAVTAGFRA